MRALLALGALACGCGGVLDDTDAGHEAAAPIVDASKPEIAFVEAAPSDVVAPFSPASVGNGVLWLDASHGVKLDVSGRVSAWADRSPSKNDAAASPAFAPTLSPSAVGGLPAIHFDESTTAYMLVADSASLRFGTGDYLVAIVARFTNEPAGGYALGAPCFFFKSTYQNGAGAGVGVWGNVPVSNGTVDDGFLLLEDESDWVVAPGAYHDGVARLFVVRRAGSTLEVRVDATSVATSTEASPVDVSGDNQPLVLGALAQTYYRIAGDVAEIVAVKGAIGGADLALLETYFTKKYAL